ncbi:MAG: hypothetical protein ACRDV9_09260, partial [Acidimicrobiia bacterium]
NGLATFAVAVGRITATPRPEVGLLATLDPWLDRIRRADPKARPGGVDAALAGVDQAMFRAATTGGVALLEVLVTVARLEEVVGRATSFREASGVWPLDLRGEAARRWAELAQGEATTPEMALALSLASLRDAGRRDQEPVGRLRFLVRPVLAQGPVLRWGDPPVVTGLGTRPVVEVLADVHARRFLSREDLGGVGHAPFRRGIPAPALQVARLCRGELDEQQLDELLRALLIIDWADVEVSPPARLEAPVGPMPLAVHAPFYRGQVLPPPQGLAVTPSPPRLDGGLPGLESEPSWAAQLGAGRVVEVTEAALRRLRMARAQPVVRSGLASSQVASGAHLGAALLCRISLPELVDLYRQVCPPSLDSPAGPPPNPSSVAIA